ncbi:MAG: peroxiredoxin [Marine Group II euryarchaeote MED-G36]|jgi:peroxiredoxin|nr:MAG: peroxiredoxin [Marine Group II euryarchaeote MED-G36]
MVEVGDIAPDFELMANDKTMVRLSESIGNRVVLAFYPAAFTGVCTKEMCTFTDSMNRLEEAEVEIFGISVDSIFANAAFSDQNQIGFPLLSDTNREATEAYGIAIPFVMPGYIASQRAVFIIDSNGMIGFSWVAENPGQEPDYEAIIDYCKS